MKWKRKIEIIVKENLENLEKKESGVDLQLWETGRIKDFNRVQFLTNGANLM